jgi:NADPH-dependent curcumin reductase CurA
MDDRKSYATPTSVGGVMEGESIATVLESRHAGFATGDLVTARTGWATHAVVEASAVRMVDTRGAPITTALGVLGMPGFTAYAGMREIGRPATGETVVVAAASGPVGSLVGQLAKIAGARAVGIAGGPTKCAALLSQFGFDAALDHHAADFEEQLAAACPNGIDVYFENVGGRVLSAVEPLLNRFARVPVCGLIGFYSSSPPDFPIDVPALMGHILRRSLTVRGFINYDLMEHHADFLRDVGPRVADGSIRYIEDVVEGLEAAPDAFMGMLEGRNFGKLLVRVT